MPFVQAKCPNCDGFLAVDNEKDAAICQFCGTPFIVEKAINNYNVTVNGGMAINNANITVTGGPTVDNLFARVKEYYQEYNIDKVNEYINRILDIDANNEDVKNFFAKIKKMETTPNLAITLSAQHSLFTQANASVYLDNVKIGSVANGQRELFCVPLGIHYIDFVVGTKRSEKEEVKILFDTFVSMAITSKHNNISFYTNYKK